MAQKKKETAVVAAPAEAAPFRPLATITAEINYYKAQTVQNIIEIGRRLKEAKEQVPHGEWGPWLKEHVDFSERSAQQLMAVADGFPNPQPVADLSYTKLVALLQVPTEDRDDFIAVPHEVNGQEKTVAEMSKRELEAAIKARDEAIRQAELSHHRIKQLEDLNEQRVDANDKLSKQLKAAQARPVEVAVREPTAAEYNDIWEEARREYQANLDEAEKTISELQAQLQGTPERDPLPPEVIQGAHLAFERSMLAALDTYRNIVLCMTVEQASEGCEYCMEVCDRVNADLWALQAKAYDLQLRQNSLELDDMDTF